MPGKPDMYDLLLEADGPHKGDLAIRNGDLCLCTGIEACAQWIHNGLMTVLGELFWAPNAGFLFDPAVFGQLELKPVIELKVRRAILGAPWVLEVRNFEITFDPAVATRYIHCHVVTEYGDVHIEEVLEWPTNTGSQAVAS